MKYWLNIVFIKTKERLAAAEKLLRRLKANVQNDDLYFYGFVEMGVDELINYFRFDLV